ncbi:hypothetical protein AA313_de0206379 [Arthrobotrys entomopaga]|nr:hypothetical protein AA313_de0206379 [Arthrobotrys entomopaga]
MEDTPKHARKLRPLHPQVVESGSPLKDKEPPPPSTSTSIARDKPASPGRPPSRIKELSEKFKNGKAPSQRKEKEKESEGKKEPERKKTPVAAPSADTTPNHKSPDVSPDEASSIKSSELYFHGETKPLCVPDSPKSCYETDLVDKDDAPFEKRARQPIALSLQSSAVRSTLPDLLNPNQKQEIFRDPELENIYEDLLKGETMPAYAHDIPENGSKGSRKSSSKKSNQEPSKESSKKSSKGSNKSQTKLEASNIDKKPKKWFKIRLGWPRLMLGWNRKTFMMLMIFMVLFGAGVFTYFFMDQDSLVPLPLSKPRSNWANCWGTCNGFGNMIVNWLTAIGLGFLVGIKPKTAWEKLCDGEVSFDVFKGLAVQLVEMVMRLFKWKKKKSWWQFWKR